MTDSTPTTPLDLDAAVEAGAKSTYEANGEFHRELGEARGREYVTPGRDGWDDANGYYRDLYLCRARATLTAARYAELVEDVKRLTLVASRAESVANSMEHFANVAVRVERRNNELIHERDAAIERAEAESAKVSTGLVLLDGLRCLERDSVTKEDCCDQPAVAVVWGTLYSKDQVGPKCLDHLHSSNPNLEATTLSGFLSGPAAIVYLVDLRTALTEVQAGAEASGPCCRRESIDYGTEDCERCDDPEALIDQIRERIANAVHGDTWEGCDPVAHQEINTAAEAALAALLAAGYVKGGQA